MAEAATNTPEVKQLTPDQMAESRKILDRMPGEKPVQEAAATPDATTEAAKQLAAQKDAEAKQLAEKEEKEKLAAATTPTKQELSDDDFLAEYEKRTGIKAASIDELKPAPKALTEKEKEALEAKEKDESLAWALENNIIKKDFYDKSIAAKAKDKRAIALALFTEEEKINNKDITPEDAEALFAEAYGEAEATDSWKYKRGQIAINKVADEYLAQYKVVDNLPEQYREAKTSVERTKEYRKTVTAALKDFPKELSFTIPYTGVDGVKTDITYSVPVDEKTMSGVIKMLTADGMEQSEFGKKAKPEQIIAEAKYHLLARSIEAGLPKMFEDHTAKVETDIMAKLKNIPNPAQPRIGVGPQEATKPKKADDPEVKSVLSKMK